MLADTVVAVVRAARAVGRAGQQLADRLGSVVTPLGWVVIGAIPLALVSGYALGWLELVAIGWAALVLSLGWEGGIGQYDAAAGEFVHADVGKKRYWRGR